jgi:uncharacterized protein YoxC
VLSAIDGIKHSIADLNDSNASDRVLALVTQASASIKSAVKPMEVQPSQFVKKRPLLPNSKE